MEYIPLKYIIMVRKNTKTAGDLQNHLGQQGCPRSWEAVCQQAPLHCSRRPSPVAHCDSLAPTSRKGERCPGGTGDRCAMGFFLYFFILDFVGLEPCCA